MTFKSVENSQNLIMLAIIYYILHLITFLKKQETT